ncbi:PAN domain-containing protein [Rosa sericea]
METHFINSVTRLRATQLLLCTLTILLFSPTTTTATTLSELPRGFKATPDSSTQTFQPLLSDSTGNFSLGFLRVNKTQLALAVLHVPSSEPFWIANPSQLARWSDRTHLTFNGSLVLSDPQTKTYWSTHTDADHVILLNNSNLLIQSANQNEAPAWQSFDFPTNTLVENQNFTSKMVLISSNGLYSMRLGPDFIGLYANFNEGSDQIYLRHKAMEAKTDIVENKGPIYAQINPDRYLGMYQTGNPLPADVQKFNSYQTPITGFLRVRLEPDGNLVGYFWDGSKWVLDYQAISQTCELPSACGSYGLCNAGNGCSCLDNRTEFASGECFAAQSGDFCSEGIPRNNFWVLRRNGVEPPYKELMGYQTTSSVEQCERLCEKNCSCWGAVFNNASGFCYMMDYPIQTLVGVGDETKMGYFKVREGAGRKKINAGVGVGIGVMCGVVLILVGIVGVWRFRVWKRKRGGGAVKSRFMEQNGGVSPGPYKDLGSASFRSIEMGST